MSLKAAIRLLKTKPHIQKAKSIEQLLEEINFKTSQDVARPKERNSTILILLPLKVDCAKDVICTEHKASQIAKAFKNTFVFMNKALSTHHDIQQSIQEIRQNRHNLTYLHNSSTDISRQQQNLYTTECIMRMALNGYIKSDFHTDKLSIKDQWPSLVILPETEKLNLQKQIKKHNTRPDATFKIETRYLDLDAATRVLEYGENNQTPSVCLSQAMSEISFTNNAQDHAMN